MLVQYAVTKLTANLELAKNYGSQHRSGITYMAASANNKYLFTAGLAHSQSSQTQSPGSNQSSSQPPVSSLHQFDIQSLIQIKTFSNLYTSPINSLWASKSSHHLLTSSPTQPIKIFDTSPKKFALLHSLPNPHTLDCKIFWEQTFASFFFGYLA